MRKLALALLLGTLPGALLLVQTVRGDDNPPPPPPPLPTHGSPTPTTKSSVAPATPQIDRVMLFRIVGHQLVQTTQVSLGDNLRFVANWSIPYGNASNRTSGDLRILKDGKTIYHRVLVGRAGARGGVLGRNLRLQKSSAVGHLTAQFTVDVAGQSAQRSLDFTVTNGAHT